MNATEVCIALNMLPTVGPVRLRKLLKVFREPQQILAARRSELRKVEGIGNEVADQISNWESTVDLAAELKRVRDFGATVITQDSPSYPRSLRGANCRSAIIMPSESSVHGAPHIMEWSRRRSWPINWLTPD